MTCASSALARTRWMAVALTLLFLVALVATADAAQFRKGSKRAVIPAGETVDDDVYVFGEHVRIDGTVNGDVIAAGADIIVKGNVTGSVMAAGRTVLIAGSVGGTVRAAGASVEVSGPVDHDVVIAGREVSTLPGAVVGRDLVAAGTEVSVAGSVNDDAVLAGDRVRLESGAVVSGNLDYASEHGLFVARDARVEGEMRDRSDQFRMKRSNPQERFVAGMIRYVRGLVGIFLLGLLFVLPFKRFANAACDRASKSVFGSLGLGFLTLIAGPLAALFMLIMGILIGGWWISFFVGVLWMLAMSLGYVVSGIVVGRWTIARLGGGGPAILAAMATGLFVLSVLKAIPFLGFFVWCVATLLGMGALILATRRPHDGEVTRQIGVENLAGP